MIDTAVTNWTENNFGERLTSTCSAILAEFWAENYSRSETIFRIRKISVGALLLTLLKLAVKLRFLMVAQSFHNFPLLGAALRYSAACCARLVFQFSQHLPSFKLQCTPPFRRTSHRTAASLQSRLPTVSSSFRPLILVHRNLFEHFNCGSHTSPPPMQ